MIFHERRVTLRRVAARLMAITLGLLAVWGVLWLASSAWAGEAERAPFVHLSSDCFTGGMVASAITGYATWPEPAKGEDGREQYILNVSVGPTIYRFCWQEKAAKEAAVAQVRQVLGP